MHTHLLLHKNIVPKHKHVCIFLRVSLQSQSMVQNLDSRLALTKKFEHRANTSYARVVRFRVLDYSIVMGSNPALLSFAYYVAGLSLASISICQGSNDYSAACRLKGGDNMLGRATTTSAARVATCTSDFEP